METPQKRRKEDTPVWLWRLECAEYDPELGLGHGPVAPRPRASFRQEAQEGSRDLPAGESVDHAFLLEKEGGERVLFLGDRMRTLNREDSPSSRLPWLKADSPESEGPDASAGSSDEAIPDIASISAGMAAEEEVAEEVTTWRAERDLQRRRMAMAKSFLVLTERMHRCRKRKELLDTLSEMAHEVLESSTTLLYFREEATPHDGSDSGRLAPRPTPELRERGLALEPLPSGAMEGLCGPMVLTAPMLEAGEEPELAGLLDAMRGLEGVSAAAVPIGEAGLLVVLERRQGRVFDDEDCFFLRSIARTVEERLARVHSGIK